MCIYGYGSITGAGFLSLEGISLVKLRTLIISGCRYEIDPLVDFLMMRSSIAQLDLRAATLNKRKIINIQHLGTSLTSLNLASCTLPSEDALGSLASSCRNIHHLNIGNVATTEYGFGVTDGGILAVVKNLKVLQTLNIRENYNLTDASLVHIYTHCANALQTLHLNCSTEEGNSNVYGADAVNQLLARCTSLTDLYFDYWHVNDKFDTKMIFPQITTRNMKQLVLGGNIVSDSNLVAISTYGKNLQTLGIFEAYGYTHTSLRNLFVGCPKLTEFYVLPTSLQRDEDNKIDEFMRFAEDQWVKARPSLVVKQTLPWRLEQFKSIQM